MNPAYRSEEGRENSYSLPPRSRAGSGVSTTESLFQGLHIVESPPTTSTYLETSRPTSSQGLAPSPAYSSHFSPQSSPYLSTTASQQQHQHQHQQHHSSTSPFPPLSDSILHADWFDLPAQPEVTPILRVDPAQDYSQRQTPSPSLTSQSATMSTAAIQFDPGFNHFSMGSRSSFTWPVLESGSGLLGHDLSSYGPTDPSLTPPSGSRSVTASPPRGTLTPEQRELKRQRDQARRDSKVSQRIRRAGSNSSQGGYDMNSPPSSMADLTSTVSLPSIPVYTTAPTDISLLTEPTTLAPQLVLPPYSPPLPSSTQGMFPSPYAAGPYMADYSAYPTSTGASLPAHYGPVGPESMMYPMPPVMQGGAPSQEGGGVRVVQSRPKPQCWEHGCNGRQFSTFSNLLRHQREKSGQAAKATCPNCGAEFTRTTARNGHLLHDKCKQRRST